MIEDDPRITAVNDARRRVEVRVPLIEEAREALPACASINLDGYMSYGRTIRLNDEAREALKKAADEEIKELRDALDQAREDLLRYELELAKGPAQVTHSPR